MIALVTDSNTMVPLTLRERYDIRQAPLTVVVDGVAHDETDDLDRAWFMNALRAGLAVSTAAPAPGRIAEIYTQCVADGATTIVSVHVGSAYSGTADAARVATQMVDVPIQIVDTGNASFAAGCAVWRAAEAIANGADVRAAVDAATAASEQVASVFTVAEIARAQRGGRLKVGEGDGVPVLALRGSDLDELGRAHAIDDASALMAARIAQAEGPLRVGVGGADADDAVAHLRAALDSLPNVTEVVTYAVGPSVAAHTGAGTFGAVYHRR